MERSESIELRLETDRFVLRKFEESDAPSLFELNNNEEVMRFTGDVPFKNLDDAVRFVQDYNENLLGQYSRYSMGRLAAIRKSDGKFIGWCGLKFHEEENLVDLGYRLLREEWKKGYATELAKKCISHGFFYHDLKEIVANVHEENIGSQKVAERCSMKIKHRYLWEGLLPARLYSINSDGYYN
jgi:RimJ/RimL family protein N-acetyltransferase